MELMSESMGNKSQTTIQTEAEYEFALAEVRRLWDAPKGTLDGDLLDKLVDLVVAYEEIHHAI